jgi:phosphoheptose isomerase
MKLMENDPRKFVEAYFDYYQRKLSTTDVSEEIYQFAETCGKVKASGNKLIFAGNGASASISSHAATDFTQHARVRTVCFNDHNLLTCFGNDYGYENWVWRALEAYADEGDVAVLISSSGRSPNIVNAARYATERGFPVITFTGFSPDNPLRAFGTPSFWLQSNAYNAVECTHLAWVLTVANLLEHGQDDHEFAAEYLGNLVQILQGIDCTGELIEFANLCREVSKRGGKIIFAGNGGSASVASHAAVDFTKGSRIRSVAFNDHNLMSAYANDYGQDQWISRCIENYADERDAVVLMSCSGTSQNVITAAQTARRKNLPLVTLTGTDPKNEVRSLGGNNFWIDSRNANTVQAVHMILLFCVADMIAGEKEYFKAAC